MKQRILMLSLSALALAAASVLLTPAADSEARNCLRCHCSPTLASPSKTVGGSSWTGGASCAEANSQLQADLEASVGCPGGFCSSQLVITTPCEMDDPAWFPVTGHLLYSCEVCIDLCQ